MKFSFQHSNFTYDGEGPQLVDGLKKLVTRSEGLGFDSFWVIDHFHQIPGVAGRHEPMLEGWSALAVMAGLFHSESGSGTRA